MSCTPCDCVEHFTTDTWLAILYVIVWNIAPQVSDELYCMWLCGTLPHRCMMCYTACDCVEHCLTGAWWAILHVIVWNIVPQVSDELYYKWLCGILPNKCLHYNIFFHLMSCVIAWNIVRTYLLNYIKYDISFDTYLCTSTVMMSAMRQCTLNSIQPGIVMNTMKKWKIDWLLQI